MNHWYVVKTKPKREQMVMACLNQAGYTLFIPSIRSVKVMKPLFPSYVFIQTDLDNPFHHRMVRFTRGVTRVLGDPEGPCPVHDCIIETLMERTKNGSLIEQELLFREGDEVTIKRGILKDLQGIVQKNISESGRVKVLFKWLNTSVRAVLRYVDLEKAV